MLKLAFFLLSAAILSGSGLGARAAELRVVGTGDGLEMLRALAAVHSEQTDVDVVIPDSIGSGGGIAAVSAGTEKLARVARPLKDTEIAAGLAYVPFAKIPSVFYVHPSVGIAALTSDQLKQIFAGEVASWKDVGGNDLKIRVVRREDGDSTLQVLRASMPGWSDLEITSRSKMAVTTQEAVQTVASVEGAIGFGPHSETLKQQTTVLNVDGMAPTDEGYPSAVELAFVYPEGKADSDMQGFIEFCRSDTAAKIISERGGIPVRK